MASPAEPTSTGKVAGRVPENQATDTEAARPARLAERAEGATSLPRAWVNSPLLTPVDIARLQRAVGNHAVRALLIDHTKAAPANPGASPPSGITLQRSAGATVQRVYLFGDNELQVLKTKWVNWKDSLTKTPNMTETDKINMEYLFTNLSDGVSRSVYYHEDLALLNKMIANTTYQARKTFLTNLRDEYTQLGGAPQQGPPQVQLPQGPPQVQLPQGPPQVQIPQGPPPQVQVPQGPPPQPQVQVPQGPPPQQGPPQPQGPVQQGPPQVQVPQGPPQVQVPQGPAPQPLPANGPAWQPPTQLATRPDPALNPSDVATKTYARKGAVFVPATGSLALLKPNSHTYDGKVEVTKEAEGTESYYEVPAGSVLYVYTPSDLPSKYPPNGSYYPPLPEPIKLSTIVTKKLKDNTEVFTFNFQDEPVLTTAQVAGPITVNYAIVKKGDTRYKVAPGDLETGTAGHQEIQGSLFPEGGPLPAHVKQTNLGDCYLQAVLAAIARSDPAHLTGMMQETAGNTVTVRFYYKNGNNYAQEYIRVDKTVATSASGGALYNDGANWARLMQKAFAVFAQNHGQYGDAYQPIGASSYAGIERGVEFKLYGVVYGAAAKETKRTEMNYSANQPGQDTTGNVEAIKQLFQFSNPAQNVDAGETVNLTASATLLAHLKRLKDVRSPGVVNSLINFSVAHNSLTQLTINNLDEAITQQTQHPDWSLAQKPKVSIVVAKAKAIAEAKGNGTLARAAELYPEDRDYAGLFELLNDIKEAGSDSSQGQRFIYSAHAYTITAVALKNAQGNLLHPTKQDVDSGAAVAQVDAEKSTITLRNPHATNVPTSGAQTGEGGGVFTITLTQFVRNFNQLDYGRVTKTG